MRMLAVFMLALMVAGCGNGGNGDVSIDLGVVRQNAKDAYTYGYPLILMERTRRVSTATPQAVGSRAPMNQYAHIRAFPDPEFKDVVSPNVDTLYSVAWVDLRSEPIVVTVPDAHRFAPPAGDARYYLLQMLDAWTNVFASPGLRTTGSDEQVFLLSGPGWHGEIPPGMQHISSPTSLVWITGRTQAIDDADIPAVHAFQDLLKLIPLSKWGLGYIPPKNVSVEDGVDLSAPPIAQVENLSAQEFFDELSTLMLHNPAADYDAPMLEKLKTLGLVPGQAFDPAALPLAKMLAIEEGYRLGRARLSALASSSGATPVNGWTVMTSGIGKYGDNYDTRAVTAVVGLGANLPEDAVYPRTANDGTGQSLSTQYQYTLTFEAGQLPPAHAFWSLTLYDDSQALVVNPINRYAVGDRSGLAMNPDGSLTIHIQKDAPGGAMANNWLPTPQGEEQLFNLIMRVYWPKDEMLNGKWVIPPVLRSKS